MKTDRLISIIMILLNKKRISARELAERFEVTPRTIYRDIDAINRAGIPVRATVGVGGGFEIMDTYKVDSKVFSTRELSTLLMGLSSLSNMAHGEELMHALAKLKSIIPADQAKDIELKANQILVDANPWMCNRNLQPYLDLVKTAMQDQRLLAFEYADRHGNKTARVVEPYRIVLKNSHWYWHGYCRMRNDFRLFRLSRVSKLRMLDEAFPSRACPKLQLDYTNEATAMQTIIELRVHVSALDRVLEYCAFEDLVPDGDDHYLAQVPFIENDYYYDVLLGLGEKCECLRPAQVREEMRRKTRALAAVYER